VRPDPKRSIKKGQPSAGLSAYGRYPMVASRIFATPLLIERSKLQTILQVLSGRMGFGLVDGVRPQSSLMWDDDDGPDPREMRARMLAAQFGVDVEPQAEGHDLVGNVAVIPVIGTLVQRGGYVGYSGMTSYDSIVQMYTAALSDQRAERILWEFDTPGGEVAGAFDAADFIYRTRGEKPSLAIASELSASAGYLLASATEKVVVARTSLVGSIGVVTAHVDYSEALKEEGIAVTFIYAGDKKVDGNPYEPLKDSARKDLQAEIDDVYNLFVSTVARNRGMSEADVRATKAGMFQGQKAIDAGLADRVGNFADELTISVSPPGAGSRLSLQTQEKPMPGKNDTAAETITAEQLNTAKTEAHAAGKAEGVTEGRAAGVKAERDRIKAIVTHADAEGRTELAHHLAFETEMTAEAAVAMLGKTPKVEAGKPGALAAAMAKLGSPGATNLPADTTTTSGAQQPVIDASSIFERRRQAVGAK